MDDILLNKAANIERCLARIAEEFDGDMKNLSNMTKQDAIILNLQRACESAIDGAMRLVRIHALGIPQESRHAFDLLARANRLDSDLAEQMKKMVGFRNIAVHDYTHLDLAVVEAILVHHLPDLAAFARHLVEQASSTRGSGYF